MIERVTARNFFCEKEHHPLRIKNDLRTLVEDRRAAAPRSSPPIVARGRGQQGDKQPSHIRKMLNLLFGMCKSQHVMDVRAQHQRSALKKDTKSVKEIHSHLNLQPSCSPIASEGEQSMEIESFEERVAHFDSENPVQQWYRDMSFGGFPYGLDSHTGTSHSHPPPFDSPPPAQTQDNEEE
jgi:hypothetical protein